MALRRILLVVVGVLVIAVAVRFWPTGPSTGSAVKTLQSPAPADQRTQAIDQLEKIGTPEAARALTAHTTDSNPEVACRALQAVGRMNLVETPAVVQPAITDSRPQVQAEALLALGRYTGEIDNAAMDQAIGLIGSSASPEVGDAAAFCVIQHASGATHADVREKMTPHLLRLLSDPSPAVQERAIGTVETLFGKRFQYNPKATDPEQHLQQAVMRAKKYLTTTDPKQ